MLNKKSVDDINVKGQKVLVRCDFNVPLQDGKTQVEVVSWYDNENSYVSQMVRTIKYFAELA